MSIVSLRTQSVKIAILRDPELIALAIGPNKAQFDISRYMEVARYGMRAPFRTAVRDVVARQA
jgi:hypothetical protein